MITMSNGETKMHDRFRAITSSTSLNSFTKTIKKYTTRRFFVGIGWCYYQSKVRANCLSFGSPEDPASRSSNDDQEIEIDCVAASWFSSRGFSFRATRTWGLWQYRFRPTRVVPDDAMIFHAACQGDISLIIKLLEDREATIYDTNQDGCNAMHVSLYHKP